MNVQDFDCIADDLIEDAVGIANQRRDADFAVLLNSPRTIRPTRHDRPKAALDEFHK